MQLPRQGWLELTLVLSAQVLKGISFAAINGRSFTGGALSLQQSARKPNPEGLTAEPQRRGERQRDRQSHSRGRPY
jgi:hypothetical protein